jgi:predicted nucleic acid-binding protein
MDAPAFRFWARLMHRQPDHHIEDAMIAATAAVRSLTVATRNVRDYKRFGVETFDPFATRTD